MQDTLSLYKKASSAWVNRAKSEAVLMELWKDQAVSSLPGELERGKEVLKGGQGVRRRVKEDKIEGAGKWKWRKQKWKRQRERKGRTYGKTEGGERKLEGGGKCQMVQLRHSMSDSTLQKDGCWEERNNKTRSEIRREKCSVCNEMR